MFQKAQRTSAKLRLALMGPSGSGKTYSALQIAKGLGGRIAMIDTERGSGSLYSHLADFDVAELVPPFEPQKYVEAILAAEKAGYDVLIIDSLSHAWSGPGGVLDIHDRVTKSVRNSFAAWREVTPAHNALVDAMLASACHVIVTLRTKTAYEVVNEGGKTKVSKVGLAPQQREGLEYEFTVVFDLSIDGHVASATKDRSGLFDGQYFTPGVEIGTRLLDWLHTGQPAALKEKSPEGVGADVRAGAYRAEKSARRRLLGRLGPPCVASRKTDSSWIIWTPCSTSLALARMPRRISPTCASGMGSRASGTWRPNSLPSSSTCLGNARRVKRRWRSLWKF